MLGVRSPSLMEPLKRLAAKLVLAFDTCSASLECGDVRACAYIINQEGDGVGVGKRGASSL